MNETLIFTFSILFYIAAFIFYSISISLGRGNFYQKARVLFGAGLVFGIAGLVMRWYNTGHPPLSNMYESLVCLSTFVGLAGWFFTYKTALPLMEAGATVASILMIGVASVFSSQSQPLIPALQSYWLHLHVSLAFVGEALFALAFILSYMYCFRQLLSPEERKNSGFKENVAAFLIVVGLPVSFIVGMVLLYNHLKNHPMYQARAHNLLYWVLLPSAGAMAALLIITWLYKGVLSAKAEKWLPELKTLDNLTYRAIALGYPLFTVGGLIFGMIWANKAWGRYWGWDPKESWALVTFLVYSAYLHVRLTRGWKGTWTAFISVIGFLVTMFTLFGVNFLISSLHSYT